MRNRAQQNKLDTIWNPHLNLKENIINLLIQESTPAKTTNSAGFYDTKLNQIQLENAECRRNLIEEISRETCTLEECYTFLYTLTLEGNGLTIDKDFLKKIQYAINKMEETKPDLKDLQANVEVGVKFKINF
jgi:hypothetical protein